MLKLKGKVHMSCVGSCVIYGTVVRMLRMCGFNLKDRKNNTELENYCDWSSQLANDEEQTTVVWIC